MEACEDSAVTQECQPISICEQILIQPNVDLSELSASRETVGPMASMSVDLASKTSETDYGVSASLLVQPNNTLQTVTAKCSGTEIYDTANCIYRNPKGIILPFL